MLGAEPRRAPGHPHRAPAAPPGARPGAASRPSAPPPLSPVPARPGAAGAPGRLRGAPARPLPGTGGVRGGGGSGPGAEEVNPVGWSPELRGPPCYKAPRRQRPVRTEPPRHGAAGHRRGTGRGGAALGGRQGFLRQPRPQEETQIGESPGMRPHRRGGPQPGEGAPGPGRGVAARYPPGAVLSPGAVLPLHAPSPPAPSPLQVPLRVPHLLQVPLRAPPLPSRSPAVLGCSVFSRCPGLHLCLSGFPLVPSQGVIPLRVLGEALGVSRCPPSFVASLRCPWLPEVSPEPLIPRVPARPRTVPVSPQG